ncbi:MAG TPA: glycosyltransferase [Planctomycetota bacterium]|nr:glycosyltransferase [Planctomycetota bacterium]
MKSTLHVRPRVLLVGPLPGGGDTIGGAKVLFQELVRGLEASGALEVEVVDTARAVTGRQGLARAWRNGWALVRTLAAILRRGRRADVVMFNASAGGALRAGPLVWFVARLLRLPLAIRHFGGNYDLAFDRAPRWRRALAVHTVLRAPLAFFETHALCDRFGTLARTAWLPNHRGLDGSARGGPCRRFLFLAQLRAEKGLYEALEASDRLPEGCELALHGPPIRELAAGLLEGHPRVRFAGELDPAKVAQALRTADALVFPSWYEGEGMPGVVIEAMQCGLPVIAARWRALAELVEDGRDGLLVEPRDAGGLARAMLRLAEDRELYAELSRNALAKGARFRSGDWIAEVEARLLELCTRSDRAVQRSAVEIQPAARPTRRAVRWLDRRLYPGFGARWDDELLRREVLRVLAPGHRLLDLGAGAGIVPQMDFRGRAARVCGVDPDPRVRENPHLDEGRIGLGDAIPYPDRSFDVVVADNVLEHLDEPEVVLREVSRLLRPGGVFLAKTPNARHYMPLIARMTPHRFHRRINRLRGRAEVDTFPTRYRANTPARIRSLARAAGLEVRSVRCIEGRPEYLRFGALTYAAGWLYERLVNSTECLAPFRLVLIAVLEKPSAPNAAPQGGSPLHPSRAALPSAVPAVAAAAEE